MTTDESVATAATLVIPAALRDVAGGRSRLRLQGATIRAMLDDLATTMPVLERRIRDEQGDVRHHLHIYLGDTDIRELSGLDTSVGPATEVFLVTAVSGG